ncbi:MAG TPA: aminotransferase class I/II-fold pyridoxal phosphate-dependent enzyme [Methanomassiliicoccales archaeon]|nr:aminotransferase class I/II-fold pyridoxal phosphate-dependent enzyme [Methanomassiliicoccales archaeon]
MMFEKDTIEILKKALDRMEDGFEGLPKVDAGYDFDSIERVMIEVAERMQDNFPYFHPYYAGQMIKPPHPLARVAYMLSMWINPNNHALDGGRASSRMEKEAVAQIAEIFGWKNSLGHLTSGGTMANMEALWISGKLNPGKKVVASDQAHYTHNRLCDVLGLDFESVPSDDDAKMDMSALEEILEKGDVGTVVATIGTTGAGSLDPLPEILELKERHGFLIHADAAYGGYFILVDNLSPGTRRILDRLHEVDSIVVDPHKHGLQPYGCGCILFKDPTVGRFYKHDSPYTYFTSSELHLGEISLECSRAGASAVALWATQRLLPMVPGGDFAMGLSKSREASLALYDKISSDDRFKTILSPELDIVVWAPNGTRASEISVRSEELFKAAEERNLYLAKFRYPSSSLRGRWKGVDFDQEYVTCLRSCLMKPEHFDWIEMIWEILDESVDSIPQ